MASSTTPTTEDFGQQQRNSTDEDLPAVHESSERSESLRLAAFAAQFDQMAFESIPPMIQVPAAHNTATGNLPLPSSHLQDLTSVEGTNPPQANSNSATADNAANIAHASTGSVATAQAVPAPVMSLPSLAHLREHGLTDAQTSAFNLWLQSAQAEWDNSNQGDEEYDPSADQDQVQTWWHIMVSRNSAYSPAEDLARAVPANNTANPVFRVRRVRRHRGLFSPNASDEEIRASTTSTTISANLPSCELTGDASIDEPAELNNTRLFNALKEDCQICTGAITEGYATKCSHVACMECSMTWLKVAKTCPTCRAPLTLVGARRVTLGAEVEQGDGSSLETAMGEGDDDDGEAKEELVCSNEGGEMEQTDGHGETYEVIGREEIG